MWTTIVRRPRTRDRSPRQSMHDGQRRARWIVAMGPLLLWRSWRLKSVVWMMDDMRVLGSIDRSKVDKIECEKRWSNIAGYT